MPDLDTQIRSYFDVTMRRVEVDDLFAVSLAPPRARQPSLRRGLSIAAVVAMIVMLVFASPLLLEGSGSQPVASIPTDARPATPITSQPAPVPLPPAPVAAWALRGDGESSVGGVALDFEGAYVMTPDGVAFDGVTGRAMTDGDGPLDTTKSLTMSMWVAFDERVADVATILGQLGEQNLGVAFEVTGRGWLFGTSDYDRPYPESGGTTIWGPRAERSGDWTHLVGVSDRDAGVIRLYLDAELVGELAANEPFRASGPLIIGSGWIGSLVEVALYQTALTSDQVAELYDTTRPTSPPPHRTPSPAP